MAYNARYVGQRYDARPLHHPTFTATSNVVLVAATQVCGVRPGRCMGVLFVHLKI